MNNEEFERKVDFIVNQQAQFAVDIQKLQEAQAVTDRKVAHAADAAAHAADAAAHAAGAAAHASQSVVRITETVDRLSSVVLEGFRFTFDSFKDTNERLQNLMDVVDRHIREGHKGDNGVEN